MDYVSTINLVPNLESDYLSVLEMVEEVAERTNAHLQTIAFSIDDALSLVRQGLVGSTIKVWGLHDFSIHDINRLKESKANLEYWHFNDIPPSKLYLENVLPYSEPRYSIRNLTSIGIITIHHSVGWVPGWTNEANVRNIAEYHVNTKGWPGIGYHFVVSPNGEIVQTNEIEVQSNHVANQNHRSIGICLGGDFRNHPPTQAAVYASQALVGELKLDLPNQVAIIPHKRMEGASTACPGYRMGGLETWMKIIAN